MIFPMQKIFIQGELGSFHHEAAIKLFGPDIEIVPCSSFASVFQTMNNDVGLVAIENSLYGSINDVYDMIEKSNVQIFAETELQIHQNLIVLPEAKLENLREIYSHPVALAQCTNYLDKNAPNVERIEFEDTAAAVRYLTENNDPAVAAIAGRQAAELYGANIIADSIEDNPVNYTRFIAISRSPEYHLESSNYIPQNKSSIILATGHQPGALYEALGIFVKYQINLTKLQSRPIIGEKWHYKFYLDFEAPASESEMLISDIKALDNEVRLLGSY